jgi:hypothetical protein
MGNQKQAKKEWPVKLGRNWVSGIESQVTKTWLQGGGKNQLLSESAK